MKAYECSRIRVEPRLPFQSQPITHQARFVSLDDVYTRYTHIVCILVLSTCTSNGIRPKDQQRLLLFPFPPFLPARHSLFTYGRFYFSLPYCFILRCASGSPRRCRWRRTAEDMLQLACTRRDDWGCPGCNRARKDWECSVREWGCRRWWGRWWLPTLGCFRNGIGIIATVRSGDTPATGTNARGRCRPCGLTHATLANARRWSCNRWLWCLGWCCVM